MKYAKLTTFVALTMMGAAGLYACDSGSPAAPGGQGPNEGGLGATTDGAIADAGTVQDTGGGGADASFDGTPAPPLYCTADGGTFVDNTANTDPVINWGFTVTSDPNHCSMIKVGSSVTWSSTAGFTTHPLEGAGGDDPNPILPDNSASVDASAAVQSVTINFPTAGTYGYRCVEHATMFGAIQVVP